MLKALILTAACLLGTTAGAAEPAAADDLQRQVQALEELTRLRAAATSDERLRELERRIDLLAAELEKLRTGSAVEGAPGTGVKGFAPAASKVYAVKQGVSIGGYGEVLYERFAGEREDGQPSGRIDQFDFLRQILYVGYKFSDQILFNSEIEFEHASTGKGGEVSVEFGYVDFQPSKHLGLRAGMVLVPMGFLNELHEPPIFSGARRPEVEQAIIPSTWRENGAGVFGEAGPVQWRGYVVSGLSSAGFTAAGIRGGRQSGARSRSEDFAFTGRVDYTGVPGLLVGGSFFTGESGQAVVQDGREIGGRVRVFDLHGQFERRGLQLRGLWARGSIGDVDLINRKNGLTGNQSVGEGQFGWYAQAGYDVMGFRAGSRWAVTPFVRYEHLDSQDGVPAGFSENPANDRSVVTAGVGVKPLSNVVLKADYQWHRNEARTGANQLNLSVGYLF